MIHDLAILALGYIVGAGIIPLPKITPFVVSMWSKAFAFFSKANATSNASVTTTTTSN